MGWLGNGFFQNRSVSSLYTAFINSKYRFLKLVILGICAIVFLARTHRQFTSTRRPQLLLPAALAIACGLAAAIMVGPLSTVPLIISCVATAAVLAVRSLPEDEVGHRVGCIGFDGPRCENTLEALRSLVAWDRSLDKATAVVLHFPYIEFDVQETADGHLVLFHDATLGRAFPSSVANAESIGALQQDLSAQCNAQLPFELASVQHLTLEQLRRLHVGGQQGVRVPTLRAFLEECAALGVQRPLAVEVKFLQSDQGRAQLLEDISWYLATHAAVLDRDLQLRSRKHPHLGWAGVISFPHLFSRNFGEFGSPQWRQWAREFRRRGIPARACHVTQLTLIYDG